VRGIQAEQRAFPSGVGSSSLSTVNAVCDLLSKRIVCTRWVMGRTKTIKTWPALSDTYGKLASTGQRWLYRGQGADFPLKPSLERALERFDLPIGELRQHEDRLLRHFKRNFHRYSSYLPSDSDKAEWLALMQHHGAPTRLMDWTYSFHIALFFAVESVKVGSTCVVWVVDNGFLRSEMLGGLSKSERAIYDKNDKDPKVLNQLLEGEARAIVPMNPSRLNERLAVQQGIFLASRCTTESFDTTFERMRMKEPKAFWKLEIVCSKKLLVAALNSLHSINIGHVSLFPGLDGFCQSFKNLLPLPNLWNYLRRT